MRNAAILTFVLAAAAILPCAGQTSATADLGGPLTMTFDEALAKIATYDEGQSRVAVIELAAIVGRDSGSAEKRKTMEAAFIKFLGSDATRAGKDQACRHLRLIGSAASVPALAKLLASEDTADMARYALERIPGPAVDQALRSMLPKSSGKVKIGIINTLGRRRVALAVPALRPLVTGSDAAVAAAAAAALGNIATAPAVTALGAARPKTSGAVRTEVNEAYLRAAGLMFERGEKKAAFAIYKQLNAAGEPEMVRISALQGLAISGGKEAAPALAAALKAAEPAVQAQAIRQLSTIPGADVAKLLGDRMGSADALGKVRILAALTDRGDKAARPILTSALKDSAVEVRVAALLGLGKLGDQSDVATLAQTAANATEAAEQQAARDGLNRLAAGGVDKAVVAGIAGGDAKLRVELIRAAAERGIAAATPALIQAARDSDRNVRRESLRSLRGTASASDAAALVDLLKAAQGSERREAERTLSSALARSANASLAPVISAYHADSNSEVRASLLQVMAQLGREEALPVLRGTLKDGNSDIRRAGILALTEWPTPAPMPDLLEIARGDANPAFQILALRGYIRLVGLPANRPPAETAGMLAQAMSMARQPDEKKAVLALLPRVVCPESLKIAEAATKDQAVASEAKMAVDRLRRALTPRKQ